MLSLKLPLRLLGATGLAALALASLHAAPSLAIDGSARADTLLSGPPNLDPSASRGIRIMNSRGGDYYPCEFYDTSKKSVVEGVITRLDRSYRLLNGAMVEFIDGFDLRITVKNDSSKYKRPAWFSETFPYWSYEKPKPAYSLKPATMVDVYVCVEFAGTQGYYDAQGVWNPANSTNGWVATDNDGYAFCHQRRDGGATGYVVPAWSLGDIPVNGSATRTVHIDVKSGGIWQGSGMYKWLESIHVEQDDVLSCPTSGFKIRSDFPWQIFVDRYSLNPTGSVFHK